MNSKFRLTLRIVLTPLFFALAALAMAGEDDWRPVTKTELEMKTPSVEPGADAEALFWEVRVDDSNDELWKKNYIRIKVFTERGRESYSKVDIRFVKGTNIKDIEAKITKADGTVLFLRKEEIFEREVLKADGFKVKAKSFAVPGLEVGSILEYRYKEQHPFSLGSIKLIFQRELPIHTITYYVKRGRGRAGLYAHAFNMGDTWFEDDKNNYQRITMANLPAFPSEPNMLPDDEIRPWMHVYYSSAPNIAKPAAYWKWINDGWYEESKTWLKPNDEIRRASASIVTGAATDDEKLKRIYDFVQTEIKNLSLATPEQPDDLKKVHGKSPSEILSLKMGNSTQVLELFGSLAAAAGYDVHAAYTGNRSERFFDPNVANAYLMLRTSLVAIKIGDGWRFFDPSNPDIPFGSLNWVLEDQMAMITSAKEPLWQEIKLSGPERAVARRSGQFTLLADGTLEGTMRIEFEGNWAAHHKSVNRGDTIAGQEAKLKTFVRKLISESAEVEDPVIESVKTGSKPFTYSLRVRVPNYAVKTGKRLIFQPNVFERNSKPRFISSTRRTEIFFSYPWSEVDDITLQLPADFALENADSPAPIKAGDEIAWLDTKMTLSADRRTLKYSRNFRFGGGGAVRFPISAYPAIKSMFDAFSRANTHQLALIENSKSSAQAR